MASPPGFLCFEIIRNASGVLVSPLIEGGERENTSERERVENTREHSENTLNQHQNGWIVKTRERENTPRTPPGFSLEKDNAFSTAREHPQNVENGIKTAESSSEGLRPKSTAENTPENARERDRERLALVFDPDWSRRHEGF